MARNIPTHKTRASSLQESFYSVPWWFKEDLTTKVLTDQKWEQDGKSGVLGYHFWSKLLFTDNVAIVPHSAAARALSLTCHEDEGMNCLYKDAPSGFMQDQ
jgi:hypothetical protein